MLSGATVKREGGAWKKTYFACFRVVHSTTSPWERGSFLGLNLRKSVRLHTNFDLCVSQHVWLSSIWKLSVFVCFGEVLWLPSTQCVYPPFFSVLSLQLVDGRARSGNGERRMDCENLERWKSPQRHKLTAPRSNRTYRGFRAGEELI